ncbi:SHOCT domain-containing protein [Streptomyces sp. NPDC059708]|uniref:SHOCT domain-containing protein n=1 Tax=Streptomyces sp. NPDC059708 TaxID=3346916 RepID=UPI00369F9873
MYWNDHMAPWGWFAMSFTTLLLWGLIAAAAVLLVRGLKRDRATGPGTPSTTEAEALLAGRYARGEIDDEEYARRLAVLRGHGTGPTSR